METNMNPDVHQELHDKGKDRRVFLVQRGYFDGQNLGVFSTEGKAKEALSKAVHVGDHVERFDRIVEFVIDQPDGEA